MSGEKWHEKHQNETSDMQDSDALSRYVDILERRIIEMGDNDVADALKTENAQLSVCCTILEKRINQLNQELSDSNNCRKELVKELNAIKNNRELTIKWAKGEIEN